MSKSITPSQSAPGKGPRTWTLRIHSNNDGGGYLFSGSDVKYPDDDYLDVVEKTAYDSVVCERDAALATVKEQTERFVTSSHLFCNLERERDQLRAELAEAKEAIEFHKAATHYETIALSEAKAEVERLNKDLVHYKEINATNYSEGRKFSELYFETQSALAEAKAQVEEACAGRDQWRKTQLELNEARAEVERLSTGHSPLALMKENAELVRHTGELQSALARKTSALEYAKKGLPQWSLTQAKRLAELEAIEKGEGK